MRPCFETSERQLDFERKNSKLNLICARVQYPVKLD